jgi:hypothetical protein
VSVRDGSGGHIGKYRISYLIIRSRDFSSTFFNCNGSLSVPFLQGIESGTKEVVCQSDKGSAITSGGGFSTYYPQPEFQKSAVAGYFAAAAAGGNRPVSGFAASGRGYPDISLAALNYVVYIGGAFFGVSGTSASAPVIAAFFSNINAARMDMGKGTIGWINPVLYSNRTFFVNDIVSGHNKCGASGKCCPQGFTATAGWDPATGLGSVDYANLHSTLIKFGVSKSVAPTNTPTPAPTKGKFSIISVTQV